VEYLAHTEIRSPDRPARSESLYGLGYPGQHHTRRRTFLTVSRWVLPSIKNVSDEIFTGNHNTHFMFSNSPPPPENRAVYEITWKNMVEPERPRDSVLRHMRISCRISKATNNKEFLCITRTVEHNHISPSSTVGIHYMFRPYMLAIFRL